MKLRVLSLAFLAGLGVIGLSGCGSEGNTVVEAPATNDDGYGGDTEVDVSSEEYAKSMAEN